MRLPGKDTNLLGHRPRGRVHRQQGSAAELGIGPKVAAMFEDPPCLVTCFIEGRELTSDELREPDALAEVGVAGCARFHDSGLELPTEFHVVHDVVRGLRRGGRSSGGELPAGYEERARASPARS